MVKQMIARLHPGDDRLDGRARLVPFSHELHDGSPLLLSVQVRCRR